MIDPTDITDFDLSVGELEERILFWVLAAGKNGKQAAASLERLCRMICPDRSEWERSPFAVIGWRVRRGPPKLSEWLQSAGIGCFNLKAEYIIDLIHSGINLQTCTVDDLQSIKGIGPKSARCFLIHSRPNQRLAGLDRHLLHFMRDRGYVVPKQTPQSNKKYKEIEALALEVADNLGLTPAEFDLGVWRKYSGNE